eukprot:gene6093-6796_t
MSYEKKKVLVRKKSLKFACSVSKSLPSSPDVEKKVVHFADTEGKTLADIKTYVPSYDDLDALRMVFLKNDGPFPPSPDGNQNLPGDKVDGAYYSRSQFLKLKGSSTKLSKKSTTPFPRPETHNVLSKCFQLDMTDIEEKLKRLKIVLEDVIIVGRTVQGRIIVENIAYDKEVSVRYTFDDWKTMEDCPAHYIPLSNEIDTDRFMFSLNIPKSCKKLIFALQYCVNGKEYWDNNSENNYKIIDCSK